MLQEIQRSMFAILVLWVLTFGTKSTVVSLKDENNKTRLLRVGTTSYNTQLKEEDVENPTMLNLLMSKKFLEQYKSDETAGRPFTSEEDIRVAYPAKKIWQRQKARN